MPDRKPQKSVEDVTKELFEAAYPDQDASWVGEQTTLARDRISRAKKEQPSTAAGARRLSDAVVNHAAPRGRRGSRVAVWLGLALVVVAGTVLGVTERKWFAEAAISTIGVSGLLAAIAVSVVGAVVTYVRSRRLRILSCRVRIDAPFGVDIGESVRMEGEHDTVADPGVVVVRVKNTGGTPIDPDDYVSPLGLRFPGRTVVSVDATEFKPTELQRVMAGLPDFAIEQDRVRLPMIALDVGDSFKLVIVLSGTKAGEKHRVEVDGGLRDGRITTREGRERVQPATLAWSGLTALCAGALGVVLLLNNVTPFTRLPAGLACVPGSLTVEGSSAFGRAATELAGSYGAYCRGSAIKVGTPGSREGLERLLDAGQDLRQRLALSDGRFNDPKFASLVSAPLAIVPFTFAVNDKVPVGALSLTDARRIFTGAARVWSDITGDPRDTAEIRVVVRSSASGTRQTLERYVLGAAQVQSTSDTCRTRLPGVPAKLPIVCEEGSTGDVIDRVATLDGAIGYADVSDVEQSTGVKKVVLDRLGPTLTDIRAGYPFWTVEYVYSSGPLEPGSLPEAFRNYVLTPEGRNTMEGFHYYACAGDVQDLCAHR
ncbi:PstS family phosphate ABC transporter substrate-binding protein [Actinocrispum wychmicini]|uniref:Phosphate transport system substrate-binding protein n=1 Tax=Actinocrispum wychmicini TaxID=1213861 RepID=A0A4R2JQU7_9PSEU|nr:substrate-binding domain-containing protein [Actinocrispum wychmicini]TCO59568.1 phosphate transport system substrate-binding protein [Actinocrispum wychmicini]